MTIEQSRWLDQQMDKALAEFAVSGWSEDGKVEFIRRRMNGAYDSVRLDLAALADARRDASY